MNSKQRGGSGWQSSPLLQDARDSTAPRNPAGGPRLAHRPLRPRSRQQLGAPLLHPRARGERTPSGVQPASPSSSPAANAPGQRALGKREAPSRLPGRAGVLTARRATARSATAPGSLARTLRGARRSLQVAGGGGARGAATATFNCAASANERARAAFERQRPRARRLRTRRAARKRTGGAP